MSGLLSENFQIGVNYWASHAGLFMWRKWDSDVLIRDLDLLAGEGFHLIRVFPLWPDFQPLTAIRGYQGGIKEIRRNEMPPDRDGLHAPDFLDERMMERFGFLLSEAELRSILINVSLINGWMSGRLFIPTALEGRNPITDPLALMWEMRFVRAFVRRFAGRSVIVGWDPGNEANCMGTADREEAWLWTQAIAGAIRREDPVTPILSGMHGLDLDGTWRIQDQAEAVDMLTTHPYSDFVPHCNNEGADSLRTIMHPAAESCFYEDLGGKAVLCQETNTLGPNLASGEVMSAYASGAAWLLWAYGIRGMTWWCAFDQNKLSEAPYDWNALERELGLFSAEGKPSLLVSSLRSLNKIFLENPVLKSIDRSRRHRDAYCLLSNDQDHWGSAFSSFLLAARAGRDLRFGYIDTPLPEYPVYLLPSVRGYESIPMRRWNELKERVRNGAVLYVSSEDAFFSEFEEVFGLRPVRREKRTENIFFEIPLIEKKVRQISRDRKFRTSYEQSGAEVLGKEKDGTPLLTRHSYGKGIVYLLGLGLETLAAETPHFFTDSDPDYYPWWRVYDLFFKESPRIEGFSQGRYLEKNSPFLFATEFHSSGRDRYVVLVNPGPETIEDIVGTVAGTRLDILYGPDSQRELRDLRVEPERYRLRVDARSATILHLAEQNVSGEDKG